MAHGESPAQQFWRRFRKHPINLLAAIGVLLLVLFGIIGPWIAPMDPLLQNISQRRLPAFSSGHLLGTDHLGRDLLSQLLYGARVAVQAAAISVIVGVVLGVPLGLLSGYLGGWFDAVMSRLADALLTFPPLLLAMAIVGVMGPNLVNAMGAIGLVFAPRFFRIVRAAVLGVRQETYIEAAHSIGTPSVSILRRHVLPNVISPVIVQISLATGFAILAEASLSYLGLGVPPPAPSWGRMLNDGRASWFYTTWPVLLPAAVIVLSVLSCNLLGDGTRDSLGREERGGRG